MIERYKPGNNRLSRRALVLINDKDFGYFLDWFRTKKQGVETEYGTHQKQDRQDAVLNACGISELSELDQSNRHSLMFWRIEREFRQWQVQMVRQNETYRR